MHDLVIRGGRVVDGTGEPTRTADVAIDGDVIVEVGRVSTKGRREMVADGALVAPGWVDVHTHYDGQATWDPEMAPSSHHGVTTVVMGNCGVGFAPVRPGDKAFLIELMEGVEDIPGTALDEGIDWRWESFGEYIDALASMHRSVDVATTVPHAAVRAYVMGERAHHDDLSAAEIAQVAELMAQGVRDGALGCSTSRTILHRSRHGLVPGTHAGDDELAAIADAMASVGRGLFQYVSDGFVDPEEREWLAYLSSVGVDVTYSLAQIPGDPDGFRLALDAAAAQSESGARLTPQVPPRPTGMLFGLQSSFHPFMAHPSFRPLWGRPLPEVVARFRDQSFRETLLGEKPNTRHRTAVALATAWHQMYRLGDPPDYEPPAEASALNTAARLGLDPDEVVYDWLLEDNGRSMIFSPLGSYVEHNHDAIREMLVHPASVVGLGDGGAHCGLICDASFPTYLLTHWARDRSRGERIPVEQVVHKQTQATAEVYGMHDRGVIAEGMLADINVIDHSSLHLHAPHMVNDLPAGGRRLLQEVDGYVATVKSGEFTFESGEATGVRSGRTLRATDDGIIRI